MKFKYEFESDTFTKGYCYDCPFSYTEIADVDWTIYCVFSCTYDECPIVEVVD